MILLLVVVGGRLLKPPIEDQKGVPIIMRLPFELLHGSRDPILEPFRSGPRVNNHTDSKGLFFATDSVYKG